MKLVLASYFETENHGPGKKIGVSPGRPKELDYECPISFPALSPEQLYWDYMDAKRKSRSAGKDEGLKIMAQAGVAFVNGYRQKLDEFIADVKKTADSDGKEPCELLPFEDGDTLLTWEKKGNQSYRDILAEYLTELGYEIEKN